MVLSFRVTRYLSLLCLKDKCSPSLEKTFCEAKWSCCNHCSRNSSDPGVVLSIAQELWPYNRKLYNIWCKAVRIADPHPDTSSANDSLALACSREVQDCFRKCSCSYLLELSFFIALSYLHCWSFSSWHLYKWPWVCWKAWACAKGGTLKLVKS